MRGITPSLRSLAAALAAVALSAAGLEAQGRPTTIVVRAVAHDAKIVGSGVGGARITVRDVETGDVLARGVQEGDTGDTDLVMRDPHRRGASIWDTRGAAAFRATLELERPTVVEVTAEGPLGTPHAVRRSAKTVLLLPGRDVTGDGIVLELNGFKVELLQPAGEAVAPGARVTVRARVEMMCGCPTTPGGLWDADGIDVVARLLRDGEEVATRSMRYAGETSLFEAELAAPQEPGRYELLVTAARPARANFGLVRGALEVGGE